MDAVVKILMVVLLLNGSAWAISPRLDSLTAKVLSNANLPPGGTNEISVASVKADVNRAIDWVCRKFPAIEKLDTLLIDSAMTGGTLPGDFRAVSWAMQIAENSDGVKFTRPMAPIDVDSLGWGAYVIDDQVIDVDADAPKLNYFTRGAVFFTRPFWSRPDTLQVQLAYFAIDTSLNADSSRTSVAKDYLERVEHRATAFVFARKMQYGAAQFWLALAEGNPIPVMREEEGKK